MNVRNVKIKSGKIIGSFFDMTFEKNQRCLHDIFSVKKVHSSIHSLFKVVLTFGNDFSC